MIAGPLCLVAAFSAVIGGMKAGSFENNAVSARNKAFWCAAAFGTMMKGLIGDILKCGKTMAAFIAQIFIGGHDGFLYVWKRISQASVVKKAVQAEGRHVSWNIP